MSDDAHSYDNWFYLKVWFALLGLTVIEIFLAYTQLSLVAMLVTLLSLSLLKSGLIVAYFMHMRFERFSVFLALIPATLICIALLAAFFPDSFRILELRPQ